MINMNYKFLLFLSTILICSCSSKETDFPNIDFMEYRWSIDYDSTRAIFTRYIECYIYAKIKADGTAEVFNYTFPTQEKVYFKTVLDNSFITKVFNTSKSPDTIALRNSFTERKIYDGSSFKLRINSIDKKSRTYSFNTNDTDLVSMSFLNILNHQDSSYRRRELEIVTDFSDLEKSRQEFIKFTAHYDTVFGPPMPPLPQKNPFQKVIYIHPDSIKNY
jgi:hypothetical protein